MVPQFKVFIGEVKPEHVTLSVHSQLITASKDCQITSGILKWYIAFAKCVESLLSYATDLLTLLGREVDDSVSMARYGTKDGTWVHISQMISD